MNTPKFNFNIGELSKGAACFTLKALGTGIGGMVAGAIVDFGLKCLMTKLSPTPTIDIQPNAPSSVPEAPAPETTTIMEGGEVLEVSFGEVGMPSTEMPEVPAE